MKDNGLKNGILLSGFLFNKVIESYFPGKKRQKKKKGNRYVSPTNFLQKSEKKLNGFCQICTNFYFKSCPLFYLFFHHFCAQSVTIFAGFEEPWKMTSVRRRINFWPINFDLCEINLTISVQ